jgi:DNA-binding CsgD family transcriptional regulator
VYAKVAALRATGPDARRAAQQDHRPLTARQRQVLDFVVQGLGNKAIAAALGISEQAAKEHVSTLLRRFGATGRAALAEIGTQLQILGSTDVDVSWLPYLFVAAPIGIQVLRGPEHRVVAINDTNRKAVDREVVGLPFRDAFPHTAARLLPLLDRVYATGEPHREFEFEGLWVRGGVMRTSYGDFVLQPIREPDGNVTGVMIFGADVTDRVVARRRAEQLTAEQLAVFDLVNEGVMVADPHGRVMKINDAFRRIIGLPDDFDDILRERVAPLRLRDASGRRLEFEEIPLIRALAGETMMWTEFISYNPILGHDIRGVYAASPMRAGDGTIIGAVLVARPRREA